MGETQYRSIGTRAEFHAAVLAAFEDAAAQGCREIWLCDTDFSDWPLSERAVVEALSRWAASHRRLLVLAQSFDEFPRRHPRWVEWRRRWSHVVSCRAVQDLEPGQMPTAMLCLGAPAYAWSTRCATVEASLATLHR
jgi:hypothetical protein